MCNICEATRLIKGFTLWTKSIHNGNIYEIKATAGSPDKGCCSFQLKKNSGEWTDWQPGEILSGIVRAAGFELDIKDRTLAHDAWLEKIFAECERLAKK